MDGVLPYGHMPNRSGHPCHGRYYNGDPVGYIQTDGRCESPIESGDTYGPTVYVAYVPAVAAMGWSGIWDRLPAAHVAASAFDILAVVGLFVAGWRLRLPPAGRGARVRLGRQPVHALLAEHELERRARRRPAGVDARGALVPGRPRRAARGGRPHEVRARWRWCRCSRRSATALADDRRLRRRRDRSCSRCSRSMRNGAVALLAPHDRLPARPGDADVDLDARHLPPGLVGPAAAPARRPGRGRAGRGRPRRRSPATARTPPPWRRSPARS